MRSIRLSPRFATHLTTDDTRYTVALLSKDTETRVNEDGSVVTVTPVAKTITVDLSEIPAEVLVAIAADYFNRQYEAVPKDKPTPRRLQVAAPRLLRVFEALNR